jgi:hypothetical protein
MTKQPIKLPEHLREQITTAVARYAAFHDRPVDDELLWAMAAKVVEASGFVRCKSEENEAEFTKLCTEFTQDILRDVARYGCCVSESVLLTGRIAHHIDSVTAEHWQMFAAICERAAPAIN